LIHTQHSYNLRRGLDSVLFISIGT